MPRPKSELMTPKAKVEFTPERKQIYLAELRKSGFQVIAAELAGVTPRCVQDHAMRDKEFAEQAQAAKDYHTENVLIREAQRRAVEGVRKAVIGGKDRDEIVLYEQEYSDALLMRLLASRKVEFSKGAGADDGTGAPGSGTGGGVLIVAQAPHTLDEWEKLFGQKAKGTTGRPEEA